MGHNEEAIQALEAGNFEKAVAKFIRAAEEAPDDPVGYVNVGNVFASIGDTEKAEPFFQKALVLDPHMGTAFYGLANLYFNQERYDEAATLYEKSIQAGVNEADAYYMLGKSLERSDKGKLGLPYMQRAMELAPDDLEIRLSYGILLANEGVYDLAEAEFKTILQADETNADAHFNLGFLYAVSTEDRESALYHLKEAFTIDPDQVQARYIYDMIQMGAENSQDGE
ncbi:TPR repeat-containing protein YrrB [Sporosarcina sp. NCCP-2716]|uniref:tetratricopeptide repeat protein n=1 Tax=Sporosarcina sp. NCCP-2716 TaxID=2943679 RepID=UPI00204246EA|nr:tetratricopeptide repeat protein [Sporosarcina sp. NCCP-2716]GKV68001.1 TPR repeat-containing protein YrrB [Sporosarcina sp. NCCP-2716]